MTHVMLDLETRGLKPGCVIASIGAVVFDPRSDQLGEHFSFNIDQDSCTAAGLVLDPETVAYWEHPERTGALAAQLVDPRPLQEVLEAFAAFWARAQGHRVWAQGSDFDPGILAAAFEAIGQVAPWTREGEKKIHNATRDTRTVYSLAGVKLDRQGTHHVAIDDAVTQVRGVQAAYRRLGLATSQRATPWDYTLENLVAGLRDANTRSHGRHVEDRERIRVLEDTIGKETMASEGLLRITGDLILSLIKDRPIDVVPAAATSVARNLGLPFPIALEDVPTWSRKGEQLLGVAIEAARARASEKTTREGGTPCYGCGAHATVVDVNLLDLCPECAEGCRIPEGEEA